MVMIISGSDITGTCHHVGYGRSKIMKPWQCTHLCTAIKLKRTVWALLWNHGKTDAVTWYLVVLEYMWCMVRARWCNLDKVNTRVQSVMWIRSKERAHLQNYDTVHTNSSWFGSKVDAEQNKNPSLCPICFLFSLWFFVRVCVCVCVCVCSKLL